MMRYSVKVFLAKLVLVPLLTVFLPVHAAQPAYLSDVVAGFPNHMIFWYEAPEPGIGRIMPVVAHHKVVIHFEGIG